MRGSAVRLPGGIGNARLPSARDANGFQVEAKEMGSFVDAAPEIFKEEKKRPMSDPAR